MSSRGPARGPASNRGTAFAHNVLKGVEKILLDSINGLRPVRNQGWCVLVLVAQAVLVCCVCIVWLYRSTYVASSGQSVFGCEASTDNLAGEAFPELGCAPAIDVVYTWVNGSDPRWLERLHHYRELQRAQDEAAAAARAQEAAHEVANEDEAGDPEWADAQSLQDLHRQINDLDAAIRDIQSSDFADFADPREASTNLRVGRPDDNKIAGHPSEAEASDTDPASSRRSLTGRYDGDEFDDPASWGQDADAYLQASLEYDELLQHEYIANAARAREDFPDSAAETGVLDDEDPFGSAPEDERPRIDEASGENRYRDNEELRFSLRSLEKYAPWVRHVYIVTDNQIPSWLDLTHPRVTIVPHTDIFANKSHLPTFSSPSIEANLHRIPGLAQKFVYFNDDVMLGGPVWPSDFYDAALGQRIFLAWGLPQCSEGCISTWIGDNFCDAACNVEACDFDGGDCVGENVQMPNFGDQEPDQFNAAENDAFGTYPFARDECFDGCRKEYLADGFCDRECSHPECGWDGVDCFSPNGPPARDMPFVFVEPFTMTLDKVATLELPFGVRAASLNLSHIENEPELTIDVASAASSEIVTKATFHQPTKTLNLVFANPGSPTEHHQVWGGTPLETYTHELNVTTFFSDTLRDRFLLGGCLLEFGCERFDTLELAMQVCLARGAACGGITSSNRYVPPVTYELRAGPATAPSYTYEESWLRTGSFTGVRALVDGEQVVAPEVVDVRLKMSDETEYRLNITSALPVHVSTNSAPSERRSLTLRNQRRRRELTLSVANVHSGQENQTVQALAIRKQARLKRTMAQSVAAFRARVEALATAALAFPAASVLGKSNASRVGFSSEAAEAANHSAAEGESPLRRRSLVDTFGGSLLHVNKLYNEAFGKRERKVIAHMPHFLQVDQIEAMQARFPQEFEHTSQNRFRSTDDMQFAFAYMYWIVHQGDQPLYPPRDYFAKELDTDGDGVLSPNELVTLAAMYAGGDAGHHSTRETLLAMVRCVDPTILDDPSSSSRADADGDTIDDQDARDEADEQSVAENKDELVRFTYEQIMACNLTREALLQKTPRKQTHSLVQEEDTPVAFQMLGNDFLDVASQLDSIRARKPKFICVNDNMDYPTFEILQEVRNFQLALFPHKSSFELPLDRRNRFLYLDDYHTHVLYYYYYARATYALILLVVCVYACPCSGSGSDVPLHGRAHTNELGHQERDSGSGPDELEVDQELAQPDDYKEQ